MAWVPLDWPGSGGCRGDGIAQRRWLAGRPDGASREPGVAPGIISSAASAPGAGHVKVYPAISFPGTITVGPDGALWFTNDGSIGRITTTGAFTAYTSAKMNDPAGITTGPDGALWFTNRGNNSIGRITIAGKVTIYTGPDINAPVGITAGPNGNLWFADNGNNSIGRITTSVTP
jgi:virginiamycin B lyase